MSVVSLKLMACAARRMVHRGSRDTLTGRACERPRHDTGVPTQWPQIRASSLGDEMAEQQNGSDKKCVEEVSGALDESPRLELPAPWSKVILSHVCAGSAMAAVFMLLSSSYITMPVMVPRPGRGVGVLTNIVMIYGEDLDYDGCSSWEDQLVAQESAWMMDPRTEHQMAHNVEWAVPQYIADGAPWIEQPHMDNAWPEPWMAEQPMGLWPPQPAEILTDSYYPGQYPLNRPGPNGLAY